MRRRLPISSGPLARLLALPLFVLLAGAAAAEHDRGVTLFRDAHFRGASQTFQDGDRVPDLGERAIGNDAASSVLVGRYCRVTLYEDTYYRGASVTLDADVAELGSTPVGNDRVSSLAVECRRPGWYDGPYAERPGQYDGDRPGWSGGRRGVILYSDEGFEGREESFYDDDPTLADNPLRQDSASSVRVAPGCHAVLFEHSDYRGAATLVTGDVPRLADTEVGNDRVSSLEVVCDGRGEGVTLYEDTGYRGRSEIFLSDDPRLRDNFVRQDGVSSVAVAPGCVVTLYEHADYRGRSATLRQDTPDLRATWVGNDTVSSIRVDCRRFRRHR